MTIATNDTFAIGVSGSVTEVRARVEAALKAEGFGVITEIDVQATMRTKLGIERSPYLILGACNPILANRAIEADPTIGLMLPCNVVVREGDGETIVEAMNPMAALGIGGGEVVQAVAEEATARLERAIATLAGPSKTQRERAPMTGSR